MAAKKTRILTGIGTLKVVIRLHTEMSPLLGIGIQVVYITIDKER